MRFRNLPVAPLLEVLQATGLSQRQLARRSGVSNRIISRLFNGQPSITDSNADRLLLAIGLHPLEVYDSTDWGGLVAMPLVGLIGWIGD